MKMAVQGGSAVWLRRYTTMPDPRLRLICFPHAGGVASAFRTWPEHLPFDVEVLAACYPGRESRLDDPLIYNMDVLVDRLDDVLRPLLDRPVALFGHSMGASVAHELAIRLSAVPGARIVGLFLSARTPPHRLPSPDPELLADEDALLAKIRELGHQNLALYEDPEFRGLILPSIAADYRIVGGYSPKPDRVVAVPITAYVGDQDPEVSFDDMREWSAATSRTFRLEVLPGGHFYLRAQEKRLVADIAGRLRVPGRV
jgi:pyochelin biosynthetic protein PchC